MTRPTTGPRSTTGPRCPATTWRWARAATSSRTHPSSGTSCRRSSRVWSRATTTTPTRCPTPAHTPGTCCTWGRSPDGGSPTRTRPGRSWADHRHGLGDPAGPGLGLLGLLDGPDVLLAVAVGQPVERVASTRHGGQRVSEVGRYLDETRGGVQGEVELDDVTRRDTGDLAVLVAHAEQEPAAHRGDRGAEGRTADGHHDLGPPTAAELLDDRRVDDEAGRGAAVALQREGEPHLKTSMIGMPCLRAKSAAPRRLCPP